MKIKKIAALGLVVVVMLCIAIPVLAANPAEAIINGHTVRASYDNSGNTKWSYHSVIGQVGSYPSGSGKLVYLYNNITNEVVAAGSSYSSYWTGNASTTYRIIEAKTYFSGRWLSTTP